MKHWHQAIAHYAEQGTPYVIATVMATTGSTPRAGGTKMVITQETICDSIGGGQFEYLVTQRAREMINTGQSAAAIHHFPLAASTLQCCGGSITVLLECFGQPELNVAVFGAGHVGQRVVTLLEDLNARIQWFDQRPQMDTSNQTTCNLLTDVETSISNLNKQAEVLVLTHDHQLDYELVKALLNNDYQHIGLIGSTTKWKRFSARLANEGFSSTQLSRIRCPVGNDSIPGKQPIAIAMSIVAELLSNAENRHEAAKNDQPLSWRQLRESLLRSDAHE
ncbi:MAG: xanthine dehydrogenase accessory protein XdhC [Pseudomonadota bacterium]